MPRLRVKSDKERRALAAVWAPVGALVKDEFTQQPATLEHAIAVRATYGREQSHNLRCADYAQPETNYASIPFVITAGDPLKRLQMTKMSRNLEKYYSQLYSYL